MINNNQLTREKYFFRMFLDIWVYLVIRYTVLSTLSVPSYTSLLITISYPQNGLLMSFLHLRSIDSVFFALSFWTNHFTCLGRRYYQWIFMNIRHNNLQVLQCSGFPHSNYVNKDTWYWTLAKRHSIISLFEKLLIYEINLHFSVTSRLYKVELHPKIICCVIYYIFTIIFTKLV